jgi:hypothetical protein
MLVCELVARVFDVLYRQQDDLLRSCQPSGSCPVLPLLYHGSRGKTHPDPNTCRKEPAYIALIEKRRDTYRKNKDIL